jgi:hypothetical protein
MISRQRKLTGIVGIFKIDQLRSTAEETKASFLSSSIFKKKSSNSKNQSAKQKLLATILAASKPDPFCVRRG